MVELLFILLSLQDFSVMVVVVVHNLFLNVSRIENGRGTGNLVIFSEKIGQIKCFEEEDKNGKSSK